MRLKGGKLLVDCSDYKAYNDYEKSLSDEEINAFLTKGADILINLHGTLVIFPFITKEIVTSDGIVTIIIGNILEENASEKLKMNLSLVDKAFYIDNL